MLKQAGLLITLACICTLLSPGQNGVVLADSGCYGKLFGCVVSAKKKVAKKRVDVANRSNGAHKAGDSEYSTSSKRASPYKPPAIPETCLRDRLACGYSTLISEPADASDPITVITITPYQAALTAAAYLPLKPGKPTVGPPPDLNKWKMAAVGYPLWIWAEGDLDPAPVSQSVGGLSVSLDASLAKIVYQMGDGTTITCGAGTPWRKGRVPAGAPSPDCGHTYTEPSLPKGDYTITATTHWSVAWTAGGQSGTIPFTQSSTTALPVGEVQTLVR